jgi:hypothetical protein
MVGVAAVGVGGRTASGSPFTKGVYVRGEVVEHMLRRLSGVVYHDYVMFLKIVHGRAAAVFNVHTQQKLFY